MKIKKGKTNQIKNKKLNKIFARKHIFRAITIEWKSLNRNKKFDLLKEMNGEFLFKDIWIL